MVRFYGGINPLEFPIWFLSVLQRAMPLLRAEETIILTDANRLAAARDSQYSSGRRKLVRAATPFDDTPVMVIVVAAEMAWWFEREGIGYKIKGL